MEYSHLSKEGKNQGKAFKEIKKGGTVKKKNGFVGKRELHGEVQELGQNGHGTKISVMLWSKTKLTKQEIKGQLYWVNMSQRNISVSHHFR